MLRSYTNVIQIQENKTGSLFQQKTKSIYLSELQKISPSYYNTEFGTLINTNEIKSYEQICFEYIHLNPVKAKLIRSNLILLPPLHFFNFLKILPPAHFISCFVLAFNEHSRKIRVLIGVSKKHSEKIVVVIGAFKMYF